MPWTARIGWICWSVSWGTFGNDETPAEGAADSLLCIKKEDASYKRYEN